VNLRVQSPLSTTLAMRAKLVNQVLAAKRLRGGGKLKVAFLTAGGLAPCLSSSIGYLIEIYNEYDPEIEIIGYVDGYKGLLKGEHVKVTPEVRRLAPVFVNSGGSPIGNSRVKLTNVKDCVKRGLVKEGQDPQKVAADQLVKDGVTVLHTIGGDDTNTAAADLAAFLKRNNYALTVVGLPKTIDNDVYPIKQSLGAMTAAQQGAIFFENVVNEHSANPRMLIVHEVMGRHSGWLTAATAKTYRERLVSRNYVPQLGLKEKCKDVHAVYVPEMSVDLDKEAERLSKIIDEVGNVNVFISEGAGTDEIIKRMEAAGQTVPRDAFGHPKLDAVNAGKFFADQLGEKIKAEKTLVQKSGYFARSAAPNDEDRALIKRCCLKAVESALLGVSGVVGQDEDTPNLELRAIEFERIAGGKPFCVGEGWFRQLLAEIGQPFTPAPHVDHDGGKHPEHASFEDELRKKLSLAGKA
jgi:diphosphate-dependent phosphofructokinase